MSEAAPTPTQVTLLAKILQEEGATLERFLALLYEEEAALLGNDPSAVEAVIQRKNELAEKLQGFERQKVRVVATTVAGGEAAQRAILAKWQTLPPLLPHWEEARRLAQLCQAQNQKNGTILREKQQLIQQALSLLLGTEAQLATYDGSGLTRAPLGGISRKIGSA
jgi:flagellar biosynthesis/type III secretory pathway chaperone